MKTLLRNYIIFSIIALSIGLIYPLRRWLNAALIDTAYVPVLRTISTIEKIHKLEDRVNKLMLENLALRAVVFRNRRQKFIARWRGEPPISDSALVPAVAVAYIPIGVPVNIVIDRGSLNGIKNNAPVITSNGLAGRIIEVKPRTSTFVSIYSNGFKVGVVDLRSGVLGVLNGGYMELNYIPRGSDVKVGDTLITSGLGRLYPYGLRVGTIASIDTSNKEEMFIKIKVRPFFDYANSAAFWVMRKW